MRVEAECISMKRVKGEQILKAYDISPGDCKNIDFLGRGIKMVAFCSLDQGIGSIWIKDPKEKAIAIKYKDLNDCEGEKVDTNSFVDIEGEQQLVISHKKGKPTREVIVSLVSDEDQDEEIKDMPIYSVQKTEKSLPIAS
jgi:hypothetical protein